MGIGWKKIVKNERAAVAVILYALWFYNVKGWPKGPTTRLLFYSTLLVHMAIATVSTFPIIMYTEYTFNILPEYST